MPIATGMLLASTLAQAGLSAGMSFGQAAKQNKLRKKAEDEAAKKMDAARSRLEKNFMESLSVPKGVFDDTMEALNSVGFAALTAAREGSQRGVGTVAQNILNTQNDAFRAVQSEREKQLFNLEAATAEEESRLRDSRASIDLQEAEGAQMAAADATEARNDAIQQGIGAVTEGIGAGLEAGAFYKTDKGMQKAAIQGQYDDAFHVNKEHGGAKNVSQLTKKLGIYNTNTEGLIDPSAYGRGKEFGEGFKPRDYRKALKGYDFNADFYKRYGQGMDSYYNFGLGGPIGR
tara:strand:+ start:229 stop:1095 length:867 start_codon:yes stop_codon:yes gene_type:complete